MIPTDFHDTDKGCCIVSFICSINRFVQIDSDGDDLLDLYSSLLDNCGLFYTQVYPDEEENDVLYADVHELSQVFRSKNCREFMRSSFGVDTTVTNKLVLPYIERAEVGKAAKYSNQNPPMVKAISIQGAFNYILNDNPKCSVILQTRQFDDDVNHVILLTKNEDDEMVFIDTSKKYVYEATKLSFEKMGYKDIVFAMSIEWALKTKRNNKMGSSKGPSESAGPSISSTTAGTSAGPSICSTSAGPSNIKSPTQSVEKGFSAGPVKPPTDSVEKGSSAGPTKSPAKTVKKGSSTGPAKSSRCRLGRKVKRKIIQGLKEKETPVTVTVKMSTNDVVKCANVGVYNCQDVSGM
jgi:hypothetical protein